MYVFIIRGSGGSCLPPCASLSGGHSLQEEAGVSVSLHLCVSLVVVLLPIVLGEVVGDGDGFLVSHGVSSLVDVFIIREEGAPMGAPWASLSGGQRIASPLIILIIIIPDSQREGPGDILIIQGIACPHHKRALILIRISFLQSPCGCPCCHGVSPLFCSLIV